MTIRKEVDQREDTNHYIYSDTFGGQNETVNHSEERLGYVTG